MFGRQPLMWERERERERDECLMLLRDPSYTSTSLEPSTGCHQSPFTVRSHASTVPLSLSAVTLIIQLPTVIINRPIVITKHPTVTITTSQWLSLKVIVTIYDDYITLFTSYIKIILNVYLYLFIFIFVLFLIRFCLSISLITFF